METRQVFDFSFKEVIFFNKRAHILAPKSFFEHIPIYSDLSRTDAPILTNSYHVY